MLRRLPLTLAVLAGLAAFLTLGPIAAAVLLLRSSSDAQGPTVGVHILIALVVLAVTAFAAFAGRELGRLLQRLPGRRR